jgi:hypothetical protein
MADSKLVMMRVGDIGFSPKTELSSNNVSKSSFVSSDSNDVSSRLYRTISEYVAPHGNHVLSSDHTEILVDKPEGNTDILNEQQKIPSATVAKRYDRAPHWDTDVLDVQKILSSEHSDLCLSSQQTNSFNSQERSPLGQACVANPHRERLAPPLVPPSFAMVTKSIGRN